MLRFNRHRQPADCWHRQNAGREMLGAFFFCLGFFVQEPHPAACWWHHAFSLLPPFLPSLFFFSLSLSLCPDVLIPNICTRWRCVSIGGDVSVPVFPGVKKAARGGSSPRLQLQSSLLSLSAQFHLHRLSCLVGFPQAIQFTLSVQYSRNRFLILMLQELQFFFISPLQAVLLFSSLAGEHVQDCSFISL